LVAATYGLNFEGIGAGFTGFNLSSAPPDTNGAIGATQYVQAVNASFAVFDKNTGALLLGAEDISTLFQSLVGSNCALQHESDPVVLYDRLANRWLISIIDGDGGTPQKFSQCIAVSTTSDATGTWNLYDFNSLGTTLPDYGKWGAWPDAYYYTSDAFPVSGNGWEEACAFDRAVILLNNGQPLQSVCFQNSNQFALMPSDLDGTTPPPSGEPNFYIGLGTDNGGTDTSLELFKFHVDFSNTANSTFTGPTSLTVAAYSPLCNGSNAGQCVPQLGTTQKLDSLNFTPMFRLAYRNFGSHESLVVNHSVDAGSSGGVRWYEIQDPSGTSGGPTVFQQGTFAPDSNWRWMGSVAMDHAGDIGAGYSVSSGAMHPAIAVTGRTPSDPLGTFESETVVFNGPGSQTPTLNRWGDYSAITVDPVDDCTFWFTTEYIPSPNGAFNWHTRIASFRMSNCTPLVASPDFKLMPSQGTVNITPGNSDSSTTITFSPLNGFSSTVTLTVAVTGAPAGVTASLNPTSVTSGSPNSTLTISTTSASPGGSFTIVITGTGGGLTRTAYVTVALPGFSLAESNSGNVFVNQGATATNTITINSFNGFSSGVTFSAGTLPAGITAVFNPNPATSTSTLTFTASGTAATTVPLGLTVTGTSGNLTQTAAINLAVSAATGTGGSGTPVDLSSSYNVAGIYRDSVTFPLTGGLDGGGAAYSSNLLTANRILSGLQFDFGPASTTNCTSACVLDAVTGDTAAPFNGGPIPLPAGQFTTLQLLATGVQGDQTSQTITVTYTDNTTSTFTQNFSDWFTPKNHTGEVEGVAMSYRDISDGTQDDRPFNLYGYSFNLNSAKTVKSFTLPNNRDVVVMATTLMGASSGSFTLSAAPSTLNVAQGGNNTSTITVNPTGGFTGSVSLAASGLPSGVTAAFTSTSATTSTLTLTATGSATTGGPTTVTITGTSGTLPPQTATIAVTVTPPASYSLTAGAATPPSISPGGSSTAAVTVTPASGYTGSVTLTCTVTSPVTFTPAQASCSFSMNPVPVTSANPVASTMTFKTVGPSGALLRHVNTFYALWLPVPGVALIGLGLGSRGSRRRKLLGCLLLWIVLATLLVLPACGSSGSGGGGGGNPGTPAGTYTLTITGKDANGLAQSNTAPTVSVTVN
jgi:hypothetical protein